MPDFVPVKRNDREPSASLTGVSARVAGKEKQEKLACDLVLWLTISLYEAQWLMWKPGWIVNGTIVSQFIASFAIVAPI
jgi:hypothetical protein